MGFPGNKKGFGSYFRLQSQATGFADLNKKYFVILFHCILMILCAAFFLKRVTESLCNSSGSTAYRENINTSSKMCISLIAVNVEVLRAVTKSYKVAWAFPWCLEGKLSLSAGSME